MLKRKSSSLGRDWIVLSDTSDDCDSDEPKVLCSVYKTENDFVASELQSHKKRDDNENDHEDLKVEEDINIKFRNFDISSTYRSDLKKWLFEKFSSQNILVECVETEFELKYWIKKLLPDPPASPSASPPSSPLASKPVEIEVDSPVLDKSKKFIDIIDSPVLDKSKIFIDVIDSPVLDKSKKLPEKSSPKENFDDLNIILDSTGDVSFLDATREIQSEENDIDCSDLFFVDTKPKTKETISVPSTPKQANFKILANKKVKNDEKKEENATPIRLSLCFNCSGNHSVRECTKPRNSLLISKNRMKYIQRNSRYHEEEDQKFASLAPGKISSRLRHALGISRREIPLHVYRMREYGYPPGWLNHARVPHSGIQMFQHNGIEVIDPNTEEPNVFQGTSRDKYDTKKFIAYPGFNVPPEPGVVDLHEELRVPPMRGYQSLDSMIKHFTSKSTKSYKTSKRKFGINLNPLNDDLMVTDMEVGVESCDEAEIEVNPPLPPCSPPPMPPPPSHEELDEPKVSLNADKTPKRSKSPTLTELEEAKRLLLGELNETPTHTTRPEATDLGTPILVSASPFSNLPTPEKFSTNISDLITFDNLPEYTGTYDRLSRVINKVRTELKEIDDD